MGKKGGEASYTNLIIHGRPQDMDEEWYKLPTPEGNRRAFLDDIDLKSTCTVPEVVKGMDTEHLGYGKVRCEHVRLGKYLSPSLFVARDADDLIKWWRRTTPSRPGDNGNSNNNDNEGTSLSNNASDATDPATSTLNTGTAYDRGDRVVDDLGNIYDIQSS